jgi:hypothetical protein
MGSFWPICYSTEASHGPAQLQASSSSSIRASSSVSAPAPPDATASPSTRRINTAALRRLHIPRHRRRRSPSTMPSLSPSSSLRAPDRNPSFSRRSPSPFRASPASAGMPKSSASPPVASLPKESSPRASSRGRRRHFPRRYPSSAASNSPPTALLRPSRHHPRAPGEALILVDPSPLRFSRRSAVPGRPSPVTGSRSGWALPQPTRLAWPPTWSLGPLWSAGLGQNDHGTKKFLQPFSISENSRNLQNS